MGRSMRRRGINASFLEVRFHRLGDGKRSSAPGGSKRLGIITKRQGAGHTSEGSVIKERGVRRRAKERIAWKGSNAVEATR